MNTELILTIQNYITALRKEETRISNARLALEKAVDALQALEESTTSAVLPEKKEQPESKAQSSPVSAYTCTQCGTPRSIGSASLCRSCYQSQAKHEVEVPPSEISRPSQADPDSQEESPITLPIPQPPQSPFSFHHPKRIHFKKKAPPTKEVFLRTPIQVASDALRQPCFFCKVARSFAPPPSNEVKGLE